MAAAKTKKVVAVCIKTRHIADNRYVKGKKYKLLQSTIDTYPESFVNEKDLTD